MKIRRWTPERDEQLRSLAASKLSAEKIAEALGPDFTRNMVIGRAHRIGVSLGARKAAPAAPEPAVGPQEAIEPVFGPVTMDALRFPISQCRWIDGETHGTATVYCGAKTNPGSSYCPEHRERCWAPYRRSAA